MSYVAGAIVVAVIMAAAYGLTNLVGKVIDDASPNDLMVKG